MTAWSIIETVALLAEGLGVWFLAGCVVALFIWVTRPLRPYDIEPRLVNPQDWGRR